MKTENLVILAALGFGAFYFAKQNRQTPQSSIRGPNNGTQRQAQQGQQTGNLIGKAVGLLGSIFGSKAQSSNQVAATVRGYSPTAGQPAGNWQYFDDGTAISPDGTQFFDGVKIFAPDAIAVNPPNSYMTAEMFQTNEF